MDDEDHKYGCGCQWCGVLRQKIFAKSHEKTDWKVCCEEWVGQSFRRAFTEDNVRCECSHPIVKQFTIKNRITNATAVVGSDHIKLFSNEDLTDWADKKEKFYSMADGEPFDLVGHQYTARPKVVNGRNNRMLHKWEATVRLNKNSRLFKFLQWIETVDPSAVVPMWCFKEKWYCKISSFSNPEGVTQIRLIKNSGVGRHGEPVTFYNLNFCRE